MQLPFEGNPVVRSSSAETPTPKARSYIYYILIDLHEFIIEADSI